MSITDLETEPLAPPGPNGTPAAEDWRTDRNGREYVPRKDGRSGNINRQGDETVEQARDRDSRPRDKRPKRRTKTPKMPDPPRAIDLKELEATLAEAFKQPAIACALAGDEWAADHFTQAGPYLARNLILASDHNPWLRRKLEEAAVGQDAMMKIVSLVGVGGALALYVVPPVIYWFNLPVPEKARIRFGIPPRREAPHAAAPQPPPGFPAADPIAA